MILPLFSYSCHPERSRGVSSRARISTARLPANLNGGRLYQVTRPRLLSLSYGMMHHLRHLMVFSSHRPLGYSRAIHFARNLDRFATNLLGRFMPHSHTTNTCQPAFVKARQFFLSLLIVALGTFTASVVAVRRPLELCIVPLELGHSETPLCAAASCYYISQRLSSDHSAMLCGLTN